jgi:hypothetical protein
MLILGVKEDFSSNVTLDSELKGVPTSGLYLNSGTHPSITPDNLLSFLPRIDFTLSAWDSGVSYGIYSVTHDKKDLVTHEGKIFQSLMNGANEEPTEPDTVYWLETNIESLKLKSFIGKVKDRVYTDLNLTKRLVNNQYLYQEGSNSHILPNDYAAWIFEPKGSDYVSIRINEMSVQIDDVTPINVYVVNQGELVTTLTATPANGKVSFQDVGYTLVGKGKFTIAIDSTTVLSDFGVIDPLKYDGFVAYTATGTGASPQDAVYSDSANSNGLGFNISAYLDGAKYIDNNIQDFGEFVRSVLELMAFEMFLHNSNNVSDRTQRIQMNEDLLLSELKRMDIDTVGSRYYKQLKKAKARIDKTFDTQLIDEEDGFTIKVGSI